MRGKHTYSSNMALVELAVLSLLRPAYEGEVMGLTTSLLNKHLYQSITHAYKYSTNIISIGLEEVLPIYWV